MTQKDCNWGSTLLRSMSIQFSFSACITAIRVPAETQNGVAKNRQDTRWESKWVIAGQRLSWGHICFGGSTLSIIRQTLYCETREKGSAAILTPDSFFGWGTSRQSTKKLSSEIISLYFSKSQLRHIFPPNSAALDRDCQRTIPTDERRNHFPTHSHTVISSFSFFVSWFWS